jgi:hypothetical protein
MFCSVLREAGDRLGMKSETLQKKNNNNNNNFPLEILSRKL